MLVRANTIEDTMRATFEENYDENGVIRLGATFEQNNGEYWVIILMVIVW